MLIFEIPKLKDEIEKAEEERAKVDSGPGLILELKRKRVLLAMIKGYCKGGTDESVFKALDKHLSKKNPGQKKDHIFVEGKRKPHTAYAVFAKTTMKIKRGDAWRQLGQYSDQSKGSTQVSLPGWGLIYLKRDREKAKLRYKNTKFDGPKDGETITRKAFDSEWNRA